MSGRSKIERRGFPRRMENSRFLAPHVSAGLAPSSAGSARSSSGSLARDAEDPHRLRGHYVVASNFLFIVYLRREILPVVQTRPCRTLTVSNCEGGRWVELAVAVDRIVVGDLQTIEFEEELFLVLSLQHS